MLKTTTKTIYICDRCKKELLTPFIIKGSVSSDFAASADKIIHQTTQNTKETNNEQ